jgi:hypothetical protein
MLENPSPFFLDYFRAVYNIKQWQGIPLTKAAFEAGKPCREGFIIVEALPEIQNLGLHQ